MMILVISGEVVWINGFAYLFESNPINCTLLGTFFWCKWTQTCIYSVYLKDFIVRIKIIHIGIAKQCKKIKIENIEMKIHLVQNESIILIHSRWKERKTNLHKRKEILNIFYCYCCCFCWFYFCACIWIKCFVVGAFCLLCFLLLCLFAKPKCWLSLHETFSKFCAQLFKCYLKCWLQKLSIIAALTLNTLLKSQLIYFIFNSFLLQ